jgi:hypothetical protein
MLENLEPAKRVRSPKEVTPVIEFNGYEGEATTPGYLGDVADFDDFLVDAGFDPLTIEVIPPMRTSRWQRWDGQWLTSYRFRFRSKSSTTDLPLLMAEAKRKVTRKPIAAPQPKAFVILWSDLQVGKVDYRGNSQTLISRIDLMQSRLVDLVKRERPERIYFVDTGDTIENFNNVSSMSQLQSNDLSIMEQVDLATTFAWQTLKMLVSYVPDVTYVSVGSNHCQWRIGSQTVGKATDDWAVFIGRQLARLASEQDLPIRFIEPQPHDESLAVDVFGDGFHILGVVHGHQAKRPEMVGDWWRKQAFGQQPVSDASLLVHGHFHHLRVTEMGSTPRGTSRFLVSASTLDNGSGWYLKNAGEDSVPGCTTLMLEKGVDFTGTVWKL